MTATRTASAVPPLTRFDRLVARLLPGHSIDEQDRRIAKTEAIRQFSIGARKASERLIAEYERADRIGRRP
jgi:hypothetical protein